MLERLGHLLVRRRRIVLVATLAFVVAAGALGGNVAKSLKAGGFEEPDVESKRAADVLGEAFKQAPPNFLLLVTAKSGTVDDPASRRDGIELTNRLLKEEHLSQVFSHWSLGAGSPLESKDRTKAIVIAQIAGNDAERAERGKALKERYTTDVGNLRVRVGGFEPIFAEVSDTIQKNLSRGESLAIPITLVLLIIVFGSVVAAFMPLSIGIVSIIGTFLVLRVIASVTDVSVFALSMVTAMGLGLAIDYSLFIVSRFREELRKGADTETAVVTTVRTAGRTVIVSGSTVAVSLSALLVFPLYFFKSFGYAGIGVVLTAVVGAVIFLPAMLAVLGPRVDKWTLWRRKQKDVGEGVWHRLALFVMKRPWQVAVTVVAALLALGIPFLHVNLGLPDERVLPPGAETRDVHDTIRRDFSSDEVNATRVVAANVGNPLKLRPQIDAYSIELSKIANVGHVDSLTGRYEKGARVEGPSVFSARFAAADATWISVIPSVDPMSKEAEAIARAIRMSPAPFDVLVGGASAQLVDAKATLFARLPVALGLIALTTFVMLLLMFGSLLVPLKALVLNLLSLTATFGAMVWIFQDGHLSGFLDFTPTGSLDISSPILMFCIAFGLSMDFEVFLLSRIKEEYDQSGDNERSVAIGLERTGRIVTAAAVLISVTFLAIGASSVRFIKLFGIGMTLAVLMDAFVIRGTLVPAFMRLAGRANWWLPPFLRPLHARVQIRAEAAEARSGPTHPPTAPRSPRPKPKPVESRAKTATKPNGRRKPAPAKAKARTRAKAPASAKAKAQASAKAKTTRKRS